MKIMTRRAPASYRPRGTAARIRGCLLGLVAGSCLEGGCVADDPNDETSTAADDAPSTLGESAGSISPSTGSSATTSSDAGTTEESTAGSSSAAASDSGSTGATPSCADQNPDFECEPLDCADPIYQFECGGTNMFDDHGCLRPWCHEDSECAAGERCYSSISCGGRPSCDTFAGCGMVGDECTCTFVGGCGDPPDPNPRGWCIPAEDFPC